MVECWTWELRVASWRLIRDTALRMSKTLNPLGLVLDQSGKTRKYPDMTEKLLSGA